MLLMMDLTQCTSCESMPWLVVISIAPLASEREPARIGEGQEPRTPKETRPTKQTIHHLGANGNGSNDWRQL